MIVIIQLDGCTLNSEPVALSHNDKYPSIAESTCYLRMCSAPLRSSSTITATCYSPTPGLPLVLPFIGATGRSVRVLTVGQGTQVAQATVVHTAIVAAISIISEGQPWPRGLDANVEIY
jgi:hypothetical protein